jgi:uncharacterized membrane protein YphA (DoxX/SURF4 family)
MKLSEPVGSAHFGPFLIRLAVGSYFLFAGLEKLDKIPVFVNVVLSFGILPDQLGTLYGLLLPYFEIVVGLMLILGVWSTLAGSLASIMLASFVVAFGVFPNSYMFFNKDIILLAATLSLLYTGAGACSFDTFNKR